MGTAARRGRPKAASRERIIEAGISVGLRNLTMTAVAAELEVAEATLYNYVSSKQELEEAIVAALVDQIDSPSSDIAHAHDHLVELGARIATVLRRHRGLTEAVIRHGASAAITTRAQADLDRLIELGLDPDTALVAHSELVWFVIGSVRVESDEPAGPPVLSPPFRDALRKYESANFRWSVDAHVLGVLTALERGSRPWATGDDTATG
ncbi:MAG: TetR family transcriptional regulator [Actinomycetota bacterium]